MAGAPPRAVSGRWGGSLTSLQVVYVDDALVVLNKPSGLLAVPGRGPERADCLSARAQQAFPDALIVHRLDMGTSGLLVMARGVDAQSALSRQFAHREVHKTYEALVAGVPAGGESGWVSIRLPLQVDWPNRPRSRVMWVGGKPSHTRWQLIEVLERQPGGIPVVCSRLGLEPVTGRSHQLRVHLLAMGHPILGDELYAPTPLAQATPRLMLHARTLAFSHPLNGRPMAFEAPTPF